MKNDSLNKETHLSWIDQAKGIGVILVILGHLIYHQDSLTPMAKAIYSFHMPMFFILSGYVLNEVDFSFFYYVKKKFLRLVVPVLLLSCFLQIIYVTVNGIDNIRSFISGLFFIEGYIYFNYPEWYFIVLFEVLAVSRAIGLIRKRFFPKIVYCLIFFISGYFAATYKIIPWFGIDRALMALGYLTIGILCRSICVDISKSLNIFIFASIFAIWIYLSIFSNSLCSMYGSAYGDFLKFIMASILGTILFLRLCILTDRISWIDYLSKHSVFIIGSHYFFVWVFNDYILQYINTQYMGLCTFLYLALIVIIYKPFSNIIAKYFPLLDGRLI